MLVLVLTQTRPSSGLCLDLVLMRWSQLQHWQKQHSACLHYDSNFLYVCISQDGGILPWSPEHQLLRHQNSACTQTSQSHQQSTQWVNNTYTLPQKSVICKPQVLHMLRFNVCQIFLVLLMPSLKSTLMCQLQPLSYQNHGSVHCVALCLACRFSRAAKVEWIKEDFRAITSLPPPLAEPD